MEIKEFISSFNNLDGKSIREKQQNFSVLLKKIPSDHDTLVNSVVPGNCLENLFKLQLLLHLQSVPDLIEILKSEEEYLQLELLKSRWFCQKLRSLLEENATDFVTNTLPYTSFRIRKKLITKVASIGNNLDTVFDEIYTRYGLNFALNLIVGCSAEKIESILQNNKVRLQPSQLKLLYRNHPKLLREYLKQGHRLDRCIIEHIARHDNEEFLQLKLDFNLEAHLGKSLTKRLLKNSKEFLISNASIFCECLHLKTVMKVLPLEDFKQFYFNCFPHCIDDMLYHTGPTGFYKISSILGRLSYPLLFEGMERVYGKCLYDFPMLVDNDMMEMMDLDERKKWIDIKTGNDLVQFMDTKDSITVIKNEINVTSSINERSRLLKLLLKTCKINNDFDALAEIGEYAASRHRNDNESVLMEFLAEYRKLFQLEQLKDQHWESIDTIINILETKNVTNSLLYDFKFKKLEFLFYQNQLPDEQIHDFLKLAKKIGLWTFSDGNLKLRKLLLSKFITVMPELMEDEERVEDYDLKLINVILEFNRGCPKDQIYIFDYPRLIKSFRNAKVSQISSILLLYETIICDKEKSNLRNEILKKYIALGTNCYSSKINLYLLKHEPEIIVDNFDKILEKTLYNSQLNIKFLKYLKKYTHLRLPERAVNYYTSQIDIIGKKENLFAALAILMSPTAYLKLIDPFYPSSDKIENQKQGSLAIAIVKSFEYTASSLIMPALLQYCKGDFLQYALKSLYSVFHRIPEIQLPGFSEELSSKSVSARKHAIFLICKVGSVENVQTTLEKFIKNERNVSVQKYLFSATLNYFIKNPSDQFWEFVKACINNLDENDSESFSLLMNLRQVPEQYKVRYVLYVWDILKESKMDRFRLLSSIPKALIVDFPVYFLSEVISENFLKSGACQMDEFVVFSLGHSNYKDEIMDLIFNNISEFKGEKGSRKSISNFVSSLVNHLGRENHYDIICRFLEQWSSVYTVVEAMSEHLKLSFTIYYLESAKDMDKFSIAIAGFLDKLVAMYGVAMLDVVSSELKRVLGMLLGCNVYKEICVLSLKLLENWGNFSCYLLAIKLLPTREPSEEKTKDLYHQIIEILEQVPQEAIQILLNVYITNME